MSVMNLIGNYNMFVKIAKLCSFIALTSLSLNAFAFAASMSTNAKYAFVMDSDTGEVLLDKRADIPTTPASMSKLLTVYILMDKLKHGVLSPDDLFVVSDNAWRKGGINTGSSTMFLKAGEKVKVMDLLKGIIIQSGNDACIVVAENIAGTENNFAKEMNVKAKELGLTNSYFKNSTGWPEEGHVMSARDIALISQKIIQDFPEYYPIFSEKSFTHNNIKQINRNPLLFNMPEVADGLKTGHTKQSGFGLAASIKDKDSNRRIIMVINGLNSMKARKEESIRLGKWALREFENINVFKKDDFVANIPVLKGEKDTVKTIAKQDILITNPKTDRKNLKVVLSYDEPLKAPLHKGDVVGKILISSPSFEEKSFDLLAGEDIQELGFFGTIWLRIKLLLGL